MSDTTKPIYTQLLNWATDLAEQHGAKAVDGELYDRPGETVYTTTRCAITSGGWVEVNLTTPAVQSDFSWRAEITIDDTAADNYQHVLLQTDDSVVETYGKNVIPVDETAAQALLKRLTTLTPAN